MNRVFRPVVLAGLIILIALTLAGSAVAQEGSSNPDVFTIGAISYELDYPDGMTFRINATSSAGPITRATVFFDFGGTSSMRAQATSIDPDSGEIVAFFDRAAAGNGLIPWLNVSYQWRLIDAEGNAIEVEPQTAVYNDPTREWQHAENDLVRIYWFDLPDWVGDEALDAVNDARERWAEGFPEAEITSRPLVVIYPDLTSFLEWRGQNGAESIRFVGTLDRTWNGTVQRIPDQARLDRECGGLNLERDYDQIVRALARSTVVHELTHFHQYAMSADKGPTWWIEGEATFFEDPVQPWDSEERVRGLAALDAIPSLEGDTLSGAGTLGPDGCTHMAYDVGASFMRFLRDNYGGYVAHGQITTLIADNVGVYAAIEQVTGQPFATLEDEWRASLGLGPAPTPIPLPTSMSFDFPTPVFSPPGGGS